MNTDAILKQGSSLYELKTGKYHTSKKEVKVKIVKQLKYGFFTVELQGKFYKTDFTNLTY